MKLASGVSEALIATACGLIIGIPALIFYSYFRGRVQKYIAELEAGATHLLAVLNAQLQHAQARAHPSAQRGARADYVMPVAPGPLDDDRPDLHGI
jgi:biopolymer transport protein ExbB